MGGVSYVEAAGADDAKWASNDRASVVMSLDTAPRGRRVGLAPHTLYTLSDGVVRDVVALARQRGLRLHVHLAETADEVEFVLSGGGPYAAANRARGLVMDLYDGSGRTPTQHLDALGGLGPDVHVAHGVHCDAGDRELLRARGTAVALCVRSNALLSGGEPPVAAYLDEGSPFALGTDSLASAPSLDLLEEACAVRALARRQGYDAPDLPRRLVEAATVGGARALGLASAGGLVADARADLAVFDVPVDADPYAALLDHGAGRCVATVLAGRLVHRARPSGHGSASP
jgi:cytosine/adenosine deaminase-related metal-dependent hydrolase